MAVNVINHLNQQFINHGVKFVIQTGDLTDNGQRPGAGHPCHLRAGALQRRHRLLSAPRQPRIIRNAATEFTRIFPQTQTGVNNLTPADALITTPYYGAPPANTNTTFTVGSKFNSPTAIDPNYAGLSYSFDYDNARFVLLDQFTIPNLACNLIENQQPWITSTLANRPSGTHAFVFGHKGFITENHADILFGPNCNGSSSNSNPSVKPAEQNAFIGSLYDNGVRYYIGGHDHMHNRAIVTSPDRASTVQNIINASNSYKFYIPQDPSNDEKYNLPTFGFLRETPIAQELFTIGYYIVTVDGPRVTVDYYSSPNGCNGDCDLTNDIIPYTFSKRETFGYSLNGKEFLVAQGDSFTAVQDSFEDTTAKILSGTNGSTATVYDGRPLTRAVDTGWTPDTSDILASNILTLWGMASNMGSAQTEVYTLSMTYDQKRVRPLHLGNGGFGLATKDDDGNWINAVDMNYGGAKKFVVGPWDPSYELSTYGVDPSSHTAWAVINYNGDFAVARDIEAVPGHRK